MTVGRALIQGEANVRRAWKIVVLVYLANFCIGLILALPMLSTLEGSLQRSGSEVQVLQGFDYDWFSNFRGSLTGWMRSLDLSLVGGGALLRNYELLLTGGLFQLDCLLIGVGVLYWLGQGFLAGGSLHILCARSCQFSLIEFLSGCGRYFFRFLRVSLFMLLSLWLVYTFILSPLGKIIDELIGEDAMERASIFITIVKYFCVALVLAAMSMVNDYAKIRTVLDGRSSAAFAILSSLYFLSRRLGSALFLYVTLLVLGAILAVSYGVLERGLAVMSASTVVLAFFLQQLFIASKMWLKLMFFSSQSLLYVDYKT